MIFNELFYKKEYMYLCRVRMMNKNEGKTCKCAILERRKFLREARDVIKRKRILLVKSFLINS